MRLVNIYSLKLEEFFGSQIPPYAVLSHTWGDDEDEISFSDLMKGETKKPGMQKVLNSCRRAKEDGIKYVWVDTCCINNDSSKDLAEAINSMFEWYQKASVCYTYLADVSHEDDAWDPASTFFSSSWFRRGWTLQELLAPKELRFYDQAWSFIGTKVDLSNEVEKITGIPRKYLLGWVDCHEASVAQRMSWASRRETKREEDLGYSLLGLFDVTMPVIHGEGRKAFERLQLKIMEQTTDDSVLAWGLEPRDSMTAEESQDHGVSTGILASSPADFVNCGHIVRRMQKSTPPNDLFISGGYVRTTLPLKQQGTGPIYGILNCRSEELEDSVIGIPLYLTSVHSSNNEYTRPLGYDSIVLPSRPSIKSSEEIRICIYGQDRPRPETVKSFWLCISGHQRLRLKLQDTWPSLEWKNGRALIGTVGRNQVLRKRYLACFSSGFEGAPSVVVVLEVELASRQELTKYCITTMPDGSSLETISKNIDLLEPRYLDMKTTVNGPSMVKMVVERDEIENGTVFSVKLSRASEITNTVSKSQQPATIKGSESLRQQNQARWLANSATEVQDSRIERLDAMKRELSEIERKRHDLDEEKAKLGRIMVQLEEDIFGKVSS